MQIQSNAAYTLSYGGYTISYAAIISYASYYLLSFGYTNGEIGTVLALSNALAMVLEIWSADLVDRSKHLTVSRLLLILGVFFAVFQGMLLLIGKKTFLLLLAYTLAMTIQATLQPHLNALSFHLERGGVPVNFGIDRAVGSLLYSLTMLAISSAVGSVGVSVIPLSNLLACGFLFAGVLWAESLRRRASAGMHAKSAVKRENSGKISLAQFIRRHPRFFVLNFGILLLFFGHQVLNGFMLQITENAGGDAGDMSNLLALTGILEIIPLFFSSFLIRKTSSRVILIVAAIGYFGRILAYTLAESVSGLYVAVCFQLIGFPLLLPSMVMYIHERMEEGEAVKGQALYTMMIALGSILGSEIGGLIIDHAGVHLLLVLCTVLTAAGTGIILGSTEKRTA